MFLYHVLGTMWFEFPNSFFAASKGLHSYLPCFPAKFFHESRVVVDYMLIRSSLDVINGGVGDRNSNCTSGTQM